MKMNPVYKRELTVSSRSIRMALILLIFNSVLAIVALFNMFTVVEQVKVTAEIQYSRFLELYTFVSSIEFLMLMFIMPALTASSISGERERQTLELMLTTTMKPKEIILGKFWSALTTMLILAISALPVQSLVFVYGGITIADMMILFLCYGIVALFTIVLLVAGTYAINVFTYRLDANEVNSYVSVLNTAARQASSGGFIYLLLLNPALTFYSVINGQAGAGDIRKPFEQWFGALPDNYIMDHWSAVSLSVQLILAIILIAISIYAVTPIHGKREKAHQHEKFRGFEREKRRQPC